MNKKRLFILDDFYKKDFKEGDVIPRVGGKFKILDLNYQNEYGTFILSEFIEKDNDEDIDSKWNTELGVGASPENLYEIIGTIHVPGYRNLLGGPGYFVKNHETDEIFGLSYSETWNLFFREGARNAVASRSTFGRHSTRLIDTIDELPSLDSHYWEIPAYNEQGQPFVPMTQKALIEIDKAIRKVVHEHARKISSNKDALTNETLDVIKDIKQLINQSEKIVILTGAGISTSSGIPDYRSSVESLWRSKSNLLVDLRQEVFENNPKGFWKSFYELIYVALKDIMPFSNTRSIFSTMRAIPVNEGHQFFAWLESELNKDVTVVTQNVDGLHQKAGNKKIIEMHGNIFNCICLSCKETRSLMHILRIDDMPICFCDKVFRPDVVFFGDEVKDYDKAVSSVEDADLIFVVGTSLEVYPFNQLIYHKNKDAKLVLINGTSLESNNQFDLEVLGDISKVCVELKNVLKKY